MYIVIAAATNHEIQPSIDFLAHQQFKVKHHEFDICITGVGSIAATYHLTSLIGKKKPDYIFQLGIAGSFASEVDLGTVVLVREELPGDLGAEENNEFKDVFDLALIHPNKPPFTNRILINPFLDDWKKYKFPEVRSVSINEITTKADRIELLKRKYAPHIETMEGAAFHYVCLLEKIPFIQIRAISNYIGERDKSKWKMKEAIDRLNSECIKIIQKIE